MSLDFDQLFETMGSAAAGAFSDGWSVAKNYALPELKKIAETLTDIEKGLSESYYTPESADILLRMQLRATQAVLVATTTLTLIAVEKAVNTIIGAIKDMFNQAVGFAFI